MRIHNTEVVSFNKNTISEEGNGNNLIESTSIEKAQSPGVCQARNRVCDADVRGHAPKNSSSSLAKTLADICGIR